MPPVPSPVVFNTLYTISGDQSKTLLILDALELLNSYFHNFQHGHPRSIDSPYTHKSKYPLPSSIDSSEHISLPPCQQLPYAQLNFSQPRLKRKSTIYIGFSPDQVLKQLKLFYDFTTPTRPSVSESIKPPQIKHSYGVFDLNGRSLDDSNDKNSEFWSKNTVWLMTAENLSNLLLNDSISFSSHVNLLLIDLTSATTSHFTGAMDPDLSAGTLKDSRLDIIMDAYRKLTLKPKIISFIRPQELSVFSLQLSPSMESQSMLEENARIVQLEQYFSSKHIKHEIQEVIYDFDQNCDYTDSPSVRSFHHYVQKLLFLAMTTLSAAKKLSTTKSSDRIPSPNIAQQKDLDIDTIMEDIKCFIQDFHARKIVETDLSHKMRKAEVVKELENLNSDCDAIMLVLIEFGVYPASKLAKDCYIYYKRLAAQKKPRSVASPVPVKPTMLERAKGFDPRLVRNDPSMMKTIYLTPTPTLGMSTDSNDIRATVTSASSTMLSVVDSAAATDSNRVLSDGEISDDCMPDLSLINIPDSMDIDPSYWLSETIDDVFRQENSDEIPDPTVDTLVPTDLSAKFRALSDLLTTPTLIFVESSALESSLASLLRDLESRIPPFKHLIAVSSNLELKLFRFQKVVQFSTFGNLSEYYHARSFVEMGEYVIMVSRHEPPSSIILDRSKAIIELIPELQTSSGVDYSKLEEVDKIRGSAFAFFPPTLQTFYMTVFDFGSSSTIFHRPSIAIITANPFDADCVPPFPVWLEGEDKSREVKTVSGGKVVLTEKEVQLVHKFQTTVWRGAAIGRKRFSKFGEFGSDMGSLNYLVVAVDGDRENWKFDWGSMSDHPPVSLYGLLCYLGERYEDGGVVPESLHECLKGCRSKDRDLEKIWSDYTGVERDAAFVYLQTAISDLNLEVYNGSEYGIFSSVELDRKIRPGVRLDKSRSKHSLYNQFTRQGYHHNMFGFLAFRKAHPVDTLFAREAVQNPKRYVFLCDACEVIPLSASFIDLVHALPSIIFYIDTHSCVEDFFVMTGLPVIPRALIFPAFVAPVSGAGTNYERLETLGDAVLKNVIVTFLYQYPSLSEGEISSRKGFIVSNSNLYAVANSFSLAKYQNTNRFSFTTWVPPFYTPATLRPSPQRTLSLKMIADFVEAIIGAYMAAGGLELAWFVTERLGLVPAQEGVWNAIYKTSEEMVMYSPPNPCLRDIQKRLGYQFKSENLLEIALTLPKEGKKCNYQRLEILGDGILDLLLVTHFYKTYPEAAPSTLHLLKRAATNGESFCRMAYYLCLHKQIEVEAPSVAYLKYLQYLDGMTEISNPLYTEIEGPKVLGDIFEALIGAIFVDSRGDWEVVWSVVYPIFQIFLKFYDPVTITDSPISLFMAEAQKKGFVNKLVKWQYERSIDGDLCCCTILLDDQFYAKAEANTKKLAKTFAARAAIDRLSAESKDAIQ